MSKILLIGGSRDGEWIEDLDVVWYRSVIRAGKTIFDPTDLFEFTTPKIEVYKKCRTQFKDGQEAQTYVIEGLTPYDAFDLLLKHYKPKPLPKEIPKLEPEDPAVAKRKAEDKLAAAAWNAFMSTPIPKQK